MSDRAGDAHPGRVVVGVHTSLSGLHALRLAVAQARMRGAALHALRAWGPLPADQPSQGAWQPALGLVRQPAGTVAGAEADQPDSNPIGRPAPAAAAGALVDQAFAETMGGEPPDLPVRTVLVADLPAPALVDYACREGDLLVIGAGRHGLPWRLRGSPVVRYCLRRAACPVLVVPPPPLTRAGSPRALLRELRREIDQLTRQVDERS
jgi:nucleotide-binding universal stress UspA family protein